MKYDGLVKSSIYVVVDLKRRFAAPHNLSTHRFRFYAWFIKLFSKSEFMPVRVLIESPSRHLQ